MIRKIIAYIIAFFYSANMLAQVSLPKEIAKIIPKANEELFYVILLRADTMAAYFDEGKYLKLYNKSNHVISQSNKAVIDKMFTVDYQRLSQNEKCQVVNLITFWCREDSFIQNLPLKKSAEVMEVLYRVPETKKLFKIYLKNKNQTWESLSSWESYELYVDYMNYIMTQPAKKRQLIHHMLLDAS